MRSDLQLIDYTFTEVTVKVLPIYKNKPPVTKPWTFNLDWDFDIGENKKVHDRYRLALWIEIKEKSANHRSPYAIRIEIMGLFDYKPYKERIPNNQLLPNVTLWGLSILYGLIRSTVGELTAQCYQGKFILPSVNFVEGLKKKTKKQ